jgi:hypothetical protein
VSIETVAVAGIELAQSARVVVVCSSGLQPIVSSGILATVLTTRITITGVGELDIVTLDIANVAYATEEFVFSGNLVLMSAPKQAVFVPLATSGPVPSTRKPEAIVSMGVPS